LIKTNLTDIKTRQNTLISTSTVQSSEHTW